MVRSIWQVIELSENLRHMLRETLIAYHVRLNLNLFTVCYSFIFTMIISSSYMLHVCHVLTLTFEISWIELNYHVILVLGRLLRQSVKGIRVL